MAIASMNEGAIASAHKGGRSPLKRSSGYLIIFLGASFAGGAPLAF
ncbi:MAG: hypothetical protein VKK04_21560 [Synechococcales bacterium]|nr:hypothetical protein [Synechococcales bacterium]